MKITFLGVSSALSSGHNSNILIDSNDGQTLLFDAGITLKQSLKDSNRDISEIDAVYISHLHSDHCGSIEWIGYYSYFVMKKKIKLYVHESMISDLWSMLRPAMDKLEGREMITLDEYFDITTFTDNSPCVVGSLYFIPCKQTHVETTHGNVYSYGSSFYHSAFDDKTWKPISCDGKCIFISSDTKDLYIPPTSTFAGNKYDYDMIFSDVDVMNLNGVHPNYNILKKFHPDIKKKMCLYHYHDIGIDMPDAVADGFKGFVTEGQIFEV